MYKFYIISKEIKRESIYQNEKMIVYTLKNINGFIVKLKIRYYDFDSDQERMKKLNKLIKEFINSENVEIIDMLD